MAGSRTTIQLAIITNLWYYVTILMVIDCSTQTYDMHKQDMHNNIMLSDYWPPYNQSMNNKGEISYATIKW